MPKTTDPDPDSDEYRNRYYAAQMHAVRAYCDFFGFWSACAYKRCRRARRCRGDYVVCMEIHRKGVADRFDAARAAVRARMPNDAGAPERKAWTFDPCTANWVGGARRERERAERRAARRGAVTQG